MPSSVAARWGALFKVSTYSYDNTAGQHVRSRNRTAVEESRRWVACGTAFGEVGPRAGADAGFSQRSSPQTKAAQPPSGRSVQRRPKSRSLPQQARLGASGPASPRASSPPPVAPKRPAEQPVQGGGASSGAGAGPDRRWMSARPVANSGRPQWQNESRIIVAEETKIREAARGCRFGCGPLPEQ